MPKDPSEENLNRPLRLLRRKLRASQFDLSKWTDIPVDTIRDHENGRVQSMTLEILRKISVTIGAAWDPDNQRWVIGSHVVQTQIPIAREFCDRYRQMLRNDPSAELQEMDLFSIKWRLEKLFERVPKSSWVKLAFRFNDYLEQLRQDFAPNDRELEGEFGRTQMRLAFSVDEKEAPCVNRGYPPQMRAKMRGKPLPSPFRNFKPIQTVLK
jgi:hypothetical protein